MKPRFLVLGLGLAALLPAYAALAPEAYAQGVVRGAQRGSDVGNRAAGPIGGAVGGAVGGVAGGVAGGVKGVLGVPQNTRVRGARHYQRQHQRRVHRQRY